MGNLAIIPARGGSKRIAKKNIRSFKGKPVIAYGIQAAMKSGLFEEVMVSTDDNEIAGIAGEYKASVPFIRSEKNSDDNATLADVLLEVVMKYREAGKSYDKVCCILPTAAMITEERIIEGYKKLFDGKYSSVIPVIRFSYPIQRALRTTDGLIVLREPEFKDTRSQDLEPHYYDSGQFYWFRTKQFCEERSLFTANTGYMVLNETEAQDVDTMEDWEMLELKYDHLKNIEGRKKI